MDGQVPADVVQERYERLVALVEEIATAENARFGGSTVEVLVAEGEGRKDAATHRMSGRARDNRLVHFYPVYPGGTTPWTPPRMGGLRSPPYPLRPPCPRGPGPATSSPRQ